jgi:hypothetical protein
LDTIYRTMLNSRTNLAKYHKFDHEDSNLLVNTIVGKILVHLRNLPWMGTTTIHEL